MSLSILRVESKSTINVDVRASQDLNGLRSKNNHQETLGNLKHEQLNVGIYIVCCIYAALFSWRDNDGKATSW